MLKKIICILTAALMIVNISACSTNKKKDTSADTFAMKDIPNYDEKEISTSIGLKRPGMKMCIDSKNTLIVTDYREKESYYLFIDNNGKKIDERKWDTKGTGSLFTLDSQDNIYSITEETTPGKDGEKSREVAYQLNINNPKGEKQKSFDLSKYTFNDKQPGITDIAVSSKGTIYLLLRREIIEVFSTEGKKLKEIPSKKVDFMEIDSEDNLLLGSFDGGNSKSSIEKLNPEKEYSLWKKELDTGNMLQQLQYSQKDKNLYILSDKGILVCTSDGNIKGYVFDLKQSSLLESSIFVGDFAINPDKNIYILAFKTDSSSGTLTSTPLLYRYSPLSGTQKPKDQKTLTFAVKFSDRFLESAVSKFQKEHPDIKLEVKDYKAATMSSSESGPGEEELQRAQKATDDFVRINNTELMAGKGADIIEITGLPYRKYIDKNTLVNISEIMQKDKSFDISKYNQRLFDAVKYKDSIYFVPVSFSFSTFGGNKSLLEKEGLKIDSEHWRWNDFLTIAQKVTKDENGDGSPDQFALPKLSSDEIFAYIYTNENNKFVDYDKETASFDSANFISILKLAKEFKDKKVCSPQLDVLKQWQFTDPGTVAFMLEYFGGYYGMTYARALVNGEVQIMNFPSYDGSTVKNKFILGRTFAINNNSELKTEAWEFIKLLLSDEVQTSPDLYDFAVNLKAQQEKAKRELSQPFIYEMLTRDKGRKINPLTQADIDFVDKLIGELDTVPYYDPQVEKIVTEGVKEFFSDKKTAEETAKLIQNKVSTYLGE